MDSLEGLAGTQANFSMSYEVLWDDEGSTQNLPIPLTIEFYKAVQESLDAIADDPFTAGRPPRSPPFAPGGLMRATEFIDPTTGATRYLRIFYEVDRARHQVGVTRITL